MKTRLLLAVAAFLHVLSATADVNDWVAGAEGIWVETSKWSLSRVPDSTDTVRIGAASFVTNNSLTYAVDVRVGYLSGAQPSVLTFADGANLTASSVLQLAETSADTAVVNMTGGQAWFNGQINDGPVGCSAELNVSGGYLEVRGVVLSGGGRVSISGGQLHIRGTNNNQLQLTNGSSLEISGNGVLSWAFGNKVDAISNLVSAGSIIWDAPGTTMLYDVWDQSWTNADGEVLYAYSTDGTVYAWTAKEKELQALKHRYSFNGNANDSAGAANLSLQGGAVVSNNVLRLPGGAYNAGHAAATGAALNEIAATVNGAKGVTFEAWVKLDVVNWSRLFCIGSDSQNNMELVPRHYVGGVVQHPMATLNGPDVGGASIFSTFGQMPQDAWCYLAAVWDDTRNMKSIHMALAGGEVVTTRDYTRHFPTHVEDLTPIFADLAISQFRLGSTFVDTSKWDLKGEIDEFRIWATALTDEQIAANVAAGPDVVGIEVGKVSIDVTKAAYPPYFKKFGSYSFIDSANMGDQLNTRIDRQGEFRSTGFFSWIREFRQGFKDEADNWLGNAPYEAGNPKGLLFKTNGVVGANYDLNWAERRRQIDAAGLIDYVQVGGFPYFGTADWGDDLYQRDPMHGPSGKPGVPVPADRIKFGQDLAMLAAKNAEYDGLLHGVFRPTIWSFWQEPEHNAGDYTVAWNSTESLNLNNAEKMYNTRLVVNDIYTPFAKRLHELEPDIRVAGMQQNATVSANQGMNQVTTYGAIGGTAYGVLTKEWIAKELSEGEVYPLDYLSCNSYKGYELSTYKYNSRFALKNLIHELFPSNPEKFNRFNRTYYFLSHYNYSNFSDSGTISVSDLYYHSDKGNFGALMENLWEIIRMPDLAYAFLGNHFGGQSGGRTQRYDRFLRVYNALPETGVKLETQIGVDGFATYDETRGFYALLANRNDYAVQAPVEVKNLDFSEARFWVLELSPSNPGSAEWVPLVGVEWNGSDIWTIPFSGNDIVFMTVNDNPFLPTGQVYADEGPEGLLPLFKSGIQRARFAASDAYIPRENAMEMTDWGYLGPPEPASCAYFDQQRGRMLLGLRDPGATACAAVILRHVPASDYTLRLKVSGIGLPETLPASTTFRVRVDFLDGNTVMQSIERRQDGVANSVSFGSIDWFPATLSGFRKEDILGNRQLALAISNWKPAGWDVADGGKRRVRVSVLVSGLEETASLMVDFDDTVPSGYEAWAAQWGVPIGDALDDFDNDGFNNLYEYAFNGDPTNPAYAGESPVLGHASNFMEVIHVQRANDPDMNYWLERSTNLVSGVWSNMGWWVMGTNVTGGAYDTVTNAVPTTEEEGFIRIRATNQ